MNQREADAKKREKARKQREYMEYQREHKTDVYLKRLETQKSYRSSRVEELRIKQRAYGAIKKPERAAYSAYYLALPGKREQKNSRKREKRIKSKLKQDLAVPKGVEGKDGLM